MKLFKIEKKIQHIFTRKLTSLRKIFMFFLKEKLKIKLVSLVEKKVGGIKKNLKKISKQLQIIHTSFYSI